MFRLIAAKCNFGSFGIRLQYMQFSRDEYFACTLEESASVMNEFLLGFFIVYFPLYCRNFFPHILDTDHV